jgi:GT2 family glycosyltransferase
MLVSVVVPVHNRPALLRTCLDSLAAQTYEDWEGVVVDDGSSEDVASVVEGRDPRIRSVRQDNAGPSVARNRGVEHARGDAILFLDSDDVLLPDALSRLVGALRDTPEADVSYGWFYLMTGEGAPRSMVCMREQPASSVDSPWPNAEAPAYGLDADGDPTAALLLDDALVMGSALIRSEAVERIGGFDPEVEYMEHWDFYLRLAAAGASFACVRAPVMVIRSHEGNRGSGNLRAMLRGRLQGIDRHGSRLPDADAQVPDRARARAYVRTAIGHCAHGDVSEGFECLSRALATRALTVEEEAVIVQFTIAAAFEGEDPVAQVTQYCRALGAGRVPTQFRRRLLATVHRRLGRRALIRRQAGHLLRHLMLATYYQPFFVAGKAFALLSSSRGT